MSDKNEDLMETPGPREDRTAGAASPSARVSAPLQVEHPGAGDATSDSAGLTQAEVFEQCRAGNVNLAPRFTTRTVSGILRSNVVTVFNGILVVSIVALLIVRSNSDAAFLAVVTFANMLVGIVNEFRAKWALDRLAVLRNTIVTARRDGSDQKIGSSEVVKGDVLRLKPGDQVVADGELVTSASIVMDESLLTGEGEGVGKSKGDPLLSGSHCLSGSGDYVTTRVGILSGVNQLTAKAKTYASRLTPTQRSINTVIKVLTAILVLLVVLLLMSAYIKHLSAKDTILSLVTVIKALVPEGLVLVSTLAFAMGAIRAAQKQVLVQKLGAVESLSHLTVLCMDKTGTLGTNHLQFHSLVPFSGSTDAVGRFLQLFVGAVGSPNQTTEAIASAYPALKSNVLGELPFSSETKLSAVRLNVDGKEFSLWLGAPEALGEKLLTLSQREQLDTLLQKGMRVLVIGRSDAALSEPSGDMRFLGFVVLCDELRTDVGSAVRFYEDRDVCLKVLSGDNALTVAAVARLAGMTVYGSTLSGPELAGMNPEEFDKAVDEGQFFGRLVPAQKQEIIKRLQSHGSFVGMIGDGVNDVLALKQADIGVAMNSGAAAARDVSDIVLLKDSFAHLPALSEEGDRIIHNIKRILQLFLTKNVYSLFFVGFVGFVGLSFPLSPRHITWIDILTIGVPATLLTLMKPSIGKQSTKRFVGEPLKFAILAGLVTAFCSLLVYANFFLFQDRGEQYGTTASVSVIVLIGLYVLTRVTTQERGRAGTALQRLTVTAFLATAPMLHLVAVYWPPLRNALGMVPLDADSWITIVTASVLGMATLHYILKDAIRRRFLGI
ncbi:cation-translocating P-type ATPase [Paraburkholderia sp. RL17-373-BIF-A]|uniref:cation-translocating P-type ATPase n=1 Tax=Paraburkholderia sp. RL17-373-BIF-A TaxID=3031629 RepID=UPI0038BAB346